MTREPREKRGSRCWCLGGSQHWVLSSPLPPFLEMLPLGSDPGGEERTRQPALQCWGFVREYTDPDCQFQSQGPLVGVRAASQLALLAHGHHTAGGPRLVRTSIQYARYICPWSRPGPMAGALAGGSEAHRQIPLGQPRSRENAKHPHSFGIPMGLVVLPWVQWTETWMGG